MDCVERVTQRHFARTSFRFQVSGFKFQVSSFRFVAQSLLRQFTIARVAKFYTEMHGFFWKRIMLKRATQRSYTLMGTRMTQI